MEIKLFCFKTYTLSPISSHSFKISKRIIILFELRISLKSSCCTYCDHQTFPIIVSWSTAGVVSNSSRSTAHIKTKRSY